MSVSQLPEYIRISKYALMTEDGRRETWEDQVGRVFGMHEQYYGSRLEPVRDLVDFARKMMLDMRALGSQRALQFAGPPTLKEHSRVFNCCTTHLNRPRAFQELFHLLLCGCGTGFSVQKHHIAMLPELEFPDINNVKTHVIGDSIEGWADALGVLLSSYFSGPDVPFPEYQGAYVQFDASKVRPRGATISSGSKAPGPEPLLRAIEKARNVLDLRLIECTDDVIRLRPIDAYDICMHASDAVLSGGIRRSASIAIFSHDDEEMAKAKTGDWWNTNPQRARSNNSALLLRDSVKFEEFERLIQHTREFGEPGFMFADSTEAVCNPCAEIVMWPVLRLQAPIEVLGADIQNGWRPTTTDEISTMRSWLKDNHGITVLDGSWSGIWWEDGEFNLSGWEMCNLSTVNGNLCKTEGDFADAAIAAAVMGTLQAGYNRFEYLGDVSSEIVRGESLLGVSITGMMDNPELFFDPRVLRDTAQLVQMINSVVAEAIGIPTAARCTALKPEGTSSLMLGTMAAGVHPWPARRGIRHVQASDMEAPFQLFKRHNPHAVEPTRKPGTEVVAFPFDAPETAKIKSEITALEMLEMVLTVQLHWVVPGTRLDRCVQPWLRNNVSNTVNVRPDEWGDVTDFIWAHREDFTAVSLLPDDGDKLYEQAPYVTVLTPEEQRRKYGEGLVAWAEQMVATIPETLGTFWNACSIAERDHKGESLSESIWLNGIRAVAESRFNGIVSFATAVIKDAWAYLRYCELNDLTVPVDWTTMYEDTDTIDFVGESACAGGACLLDLNSVEIGAK